MPLWTVVNIASVAGKEGNLNAAAHSASKAAAIGLTNRLATNLRKKHSGKLGDAGGRNGAVFTNDGSTNFLYVKENSNETLRPSLDRSAVEALTWWRECLLR